jgi:N-acetylmuramoyl-L-alanine amidase
MLLLLVVLAGCATTGPRTMPSGPLPPDVDLTPPPDTVVQIPPPDVPPKIASTNAPAPAPVTVPPQPNDHVNAGETWVPLERWCQVSGYGALRRVANDVSPTYAFAGTSGTMVVHVGSEVASWRGAEFHLGFAPQLINGHPFVHALDVRKNIFPLLENPAHPTTNRVIVIDPGHGGTDTGTRNVVNGHYEKEFTLDLARRLQSLLATNGWTVLLTRTNDVFVPLQSRVAFAEQHKAGLFVSLHFNSAFPDREEAGLETYCLTPQGMHSTLTRGFADNPSYSFPNNHFDTENLQYAARLHRAVLKVNGHTDRGVRRARFLGVLQGQNRPALLIEGGYLSNPGEARKIAEPAYRQKVAEAIARELSVDIVNPVNVASVEGTNKPPSTNFQAPENQKTPSTNTNGVVGSIGNRGVGND